MFGQVLLQNTSSLRKTFALHELCKTLTSGILATINEKIQLILNQQKGGPDGRCFHAAWAVSKSAH